MKKLWAPDFGGSCRQDLQDFHDLQDWLILKILLILSKTWAAKHTTAKCTRALPFIN
jgi:hypothetical protein